MWFRSDKWLEKHTHSLSGLRVVLFGSTGGIGNELCRYILQLGGELITVDRNPSKAAALTKKLREDYPNSRISNITADLTELHSVKEACSCLEQIGVDVLIHNAGAYSIPRTICATGLDNVFQINFASPYYITARLMPMLSRRQGSVVVVGSIAHNYSKSDSQDIDFKTRRKASLVYGNAKRYWMFSAYDLAQKNPDVQFAVTHPGITLTNITAHYPKWLFALIKHPMKVVFMPPKLAALSILRGIFLATPNGYWIGPSIFNVWGKPKLQKLNTCTLQEQQYIIKTAEKIYQELQ